MSRTIRTCLTAAAAAALLAACADDPFDRPGTVAPRGFNDANLRAMVVDPAHLRRGLENTAVRGDSATRPVDLLRAGKRPPLLSSSTGANVGGGGNGGQ